MTDTHTLGFEQVRATIIANPHLIMDDIELVKALASVANGDLGDNVVDMRSVALKSLEERLEALEHSNKEVVAASYENAINTENVQKAVLAMLEPNSCQGFLDALMSRIPEAIKVDRIRILIERSESMENAERMLGNVMHSPVALCQPGSINNYLSYEGNMAGKDGIFLRQVASGDPEIYGQIGPAIRSEALVMFDRGKSRSPWLLVAGAVDPNQFQPGMGTELLAFFSAVVFSQCRRWLG